MAPFEGFIRAAAADTPSVLPGLPGFNQENLQPWTVQVTASMTVLALLCVVLRIVSRNIRKQPLGWDDRMIIFSMVSFRSNECRRYRTKVLPKDAQRALLSLLCLTDNSN
jgi:hypothetical protein